MSTVKSKNLQVGTDATASNNFTIYQPSTPDGTLRIGVGNADSPTEVARVNSDGLADANGQKLSNTPIVVAKKTSSQVPSNATWTKIELNTTDIDTDSAFDTSTNYRFTVPTGKAGKYLINASVLANAITTSNLKRSLCAVRKNGSEMRPRHDQNCDLNYLASTTNNITLILDLAEGDYLELWGYITWASGSGQFETGGTCLSLHKIIG